MGLGGLIKGAAKTALPGYLPLQVGAGLLGIQRGIGMPELQEAQLDPASSQILDRKIKEAGMPADQFADQLVGEQTGNMDLAKNFMTGGGSKPGMIDGTSDALRKRQERQMGSMTNNMQRSIRASAPAVQASRLGNTLAATDKNSQAALSFAKKTALAEQNRRFARNNAINQIVRGTATVGGAAAGAYFGGPEGARAGAALGQGIGGSVGPQGGNLGYIGQ